MLVIDNGDAIKGIAEVATKLDFIVNGYVGSTATQLSDGQLGTGEADLYLSGADATVVTSITIVNTDSAARTFTLYLKPDGGTSRAITPVSLDLGAGHSFYTDGQRMVVMDKDGGVVSTAAVHDLGGSQHGADTLSNLNTKVSDATLVDASAISSEIDGDISTHAASATVHQNAPALIGTHASDIDAHISGATAGELLVATGATTAVLKNTGVKLTAPDISGIVTAASALTMPGFSLSSLIRSNVGPSFQRNVDNDLLGISGGTGQSDGSGAQIVLSGKDRSSFNGFMFLGTPNAAGNGNIYRLTMTGKTATSVATWSDITHTGIVLSGSLTLNGQVFDAGAGGLKINTTGGSQGLTLQNTQDSASGVVILANHISASPAINDELLLFGADGRDSIGAVTGYIKLKFLIENPVDGSEAGSMLWYMKSGGSWNTSMTLSGAGALDAKDSFKVNGTQVVSAQGGAVADPTDAASTQARLIDLLGRLRTHGMIST